MDREKYLELEHEYGVELRGHIEDIRACAEVARYLGDSKSSGFLTDMADKLQRDRDWRLSDSQSRYLDSLRRRFTPQIPMLPELKRRAVEKYEAEKKLREETERAQKGEAKAEEAFLLNLAKDMKVEGWKSFFDDVEWWFDYEAPPYKATIRKYQTDYKISVERDGKDIYTKKFTESPQGRGDAYRREEAETVEKAKKMALGAIEKDRRSLAPQQPAPPTPPARDDLLAKARQLAEAAKVSGNAYMTTFALSIASQLARGRTLSEKQQVVLDRGLKQYRIAAYDYDRRG